MAMAAEGDNLRPGDLQADDVHDFERSSSRRGLLSAGELDPMIVAVFCIVGVILLCSTAVFVRRVRARGSSGLVQQNHAAKKAPPDNTGILIVHG